MRTHRRPSLRWRILAWLAPALIAAGCIPRDAADAPEAAAATGEAESALVCPSCLAYRFRPYLKFSKDGEREKYCPQTWRSLYNGSMLLYTGRPVSVLETPANIQRSYSVVLQHSDVRSSISDQVVLAPGSRGECGSGYSWPQVSYTGAVYAHVSTATSSCPAQGPQDPNIINIEYWLLFGYNEVHSLFGQADHAFDLASILVQYSAQQDRIVRVTYSAHGCVLMQYNLDGAACVQGTTSLSGLDVNGNSTSVQAQAIYIGNACARDSGCSFGASLGSPNPVVYLVKDDQTGKFEHPAAFLEWGSHEPWPNASGDLFAMPKHGGDDASFIPSVLHILNSADDPPFIYFGGHYGDPAGIMRHRGWYLDSDGPCVGDSQRNDLNPFSGPPCNPSGFSTSSAPRSTCANPKPTPKPGCTLDSQCHCSCKRPAICHAECQDGRCVCLRD